MLVRLLWCSLMLLAVPSFARAEPFAVEGLRLGMTLADVRLSPAIGAGNRVICNIDREAIDVRPQSDLLPDRETSANAPTSCGIFRFAKRFERDTTLPAEWLPARMQLGTIEYSPALVFVPSDTPEGSPRLARITLRSNATFWEALLPSLLQRYGKPVSREKSQARYPDNETVVWENAESTIRAVKRSDRYQRTTIVFEHKALAAIAGWRAAEATQGR